MQALVLSCGKLGLDDLIAPILDALALSGGAPTRALLRACFVGTAMARDALAAEGVPLMPAFFPCASARVDGLCGRTLAGAGGGTGPHTPDTTTTAGIVGQSAALEASLRIAALCACGDLDDALSAAEQVICTCCSV